MHVYINGVHNDILPKISFKYVFDDATGQCRLFPLIFKNLTVSIFSITCLSAGAFSRCMGIQEV